MEKFYKNELLEDELKDNTIKEYLDKIRAINCMGYNIKYDIENKRTIISSLWDDTKYSVSIPKEFIKYYWDKEIGWWVIPAEEMKGAQQV